MQTLEPRQAAVKGRIVLSGATGYIGRRLVAHLLRDGWSITLLGCAAPPAGTTTGAAMRALPWRLGDDIPVAAFDGRSDWPTARAVIHLAHDWSGDPALLEDRNVAGARKLLAAARLAGVGNFIFASSMSARADAPNRYGRSKFAVERLLTGPREIAARIGLVYGGPLQGLYGTMCRLTRVSPVLPMVDGHQLIQPIHLDEVCTALIELATRTGFDRRIFPLGSPHPISFAEFVGLLAAERTGRKIRLLPIPRVVALAIADLTGFLPGIPKVDRERVLGLAGIRVQDSAPALDELRLALGPIAATMRKESGQGRRRLLAEGRALLSYCSGRPATAVRARAYVRGLELLAMPDPLPLGKIVQRWPRLLRLIDPGGGAVAEPRPLRRRCLMALRILEASPEGGAALHADRPVGRVWLLLALLRIGLIEAALLPIRSVLTRVRR